MEPSTARGGATGGSPGLPEATACHRPTLASGSPEAQGPPARPPHHRAGRWQNKLIHGRGDLKETPPNPGASTSEESSAPTIPTAAPPPQPRLMTLELPQAEALQAPGQGVPSPLHPAINSEGTCLDSPDTTGCTDPRWTGCRGQSGHLPRQARSGPAPTPCPAALTRPTGRWLPRPELLAQRWRDQGHRQADDLSAKSSQAWISKAALVARDSNLCLSLKAGPRLLPAPPLTKPGLDASGPACHRPRDLP